MSRIPVRDALGRLHAEGLVTVRPNRAVIITELAPADVMEIFEMRAALEALAVRVALPNLRGEALHEIDDLSATAAPARVVEDGVDPVGVRGALAHPFTAVLASPTMPRASIPALPSG